MDREDWENAKSLYGEWSQAGPPPGEIPLEVAHRQYLFGILAVMTRQSKETVDVHLENVRKAPMVGHHAAHLSALVESAFGSPEHAARARKRLCQVLDSTYGVPKAPTRLRLLAEQLLKRAAG